MRDLSLTEDDVATEREVILEERSQRIDSDPGALMQRTDACGAVPQPSLRPSRSSAGGTRWRR